MSGAEIDCFLKQVIPSNKLDESFCGAAARELQEEVGFAPGETELLAEFRCSTGLLRHRHGIVLATDLNEAERTLDSNEFPGAKIGPG